MSDAPLPFEAFFSFKILIETPIQFLNTSIMSVLVLSKLVRIFSECTASYFFYKSFFLLPVLQ